MMYAFLGAMNGSIPRSQIRRVLHTYDVNCIFWKRFWDRMNTLPEHLQRKEAFEVVFKIPRMHIYGHQQSCQAPFSLHWTRYSAMMDGEHVERLWSLLNYTASSTKEQGPGAREDQIHDHAGAINYRKKLEMGKHTFKLRLSLCTQPLLVGNLFLRKMQEACRMSVKMRSEYERFRKVLCSDLPEEVESWDVKIAVWDEDPSQPCPYVVPECGKPSFEALFKDVVLTLTL